MCKNTHPDFYFFFKSNRTTKSPTHWHFVWQHCCWYNLVFSWCFGRKLLSCHISKHFWPYLVAAQRAGNFIGQSNINHILPEIMQTWFPKNLLKRVLLNWSWVIISKRKFANEAKKFVWRTGNRSYILIKHINCINQPYYSSSENMDS